jgi:hypothetical protein
MPITLLLLLFACSSEEVVTLYGTLLEGHNAEAVPLGGADLSVYEDQGQPYASTVSEADGSFEVSAPGGQNIFVEVAGDGLVPASFTGVAGLFEQQEIEEGLVFAVTEADYSEWVADFGGCEALDTNTASVIGDIRLYGLLDADSGEEIVVTTGYAYVESLDGTVYEACYLDEEGVAFDPEAVATGLSGRYTIAGVPAGVHTLVVGYVGAGGVVGEHDYFLWLPEGGVSPRFPSYVELVY